MRQIPCALAGISLIVAIIYLHAKFAGRYLHRREFAARAEPFLNGGEVFRAHFPHALRQQFRQQRIVIKVMVQQQLHRSEVLRRLGLRMPRDAG